MITGTARRRRWATSEKLRIVEESFEPGATVSEVARRNGVAPNLLFRWRRLMTEGGTVAVGVDEDVVGGSEVRRLEERVRELERLLGRMHDQAGEHGVTLGFGLISGGTHYCTQTRTARLG